MKTNPIKRSKTRHIVSVLMMLLLAAFSATAQSGSRSIRGIVVDENGDPLPGAVVKQVMQKDGESIVSIITDNQGHFGLSVPKETKAIEVSFLGFDSQKINLTNAADYRIQMVASNNYLSEVVVTGYQTISKERATGSFVKVDSEKLNEKRLTSISSMLEGTVAGYNDGLIRGVTSMNVSTTPLYVVDGFPIENMAFDQYGSLNESLPNLNMEDVESITVLKDAAAASIYGSRAANGVIVITTKRPKDLGQVDVSLSATLTVHPYSYYTGNVANSALVVDLEREWAAQNPNLKGEGAAAYAQNTLDNMIYPSAGIKTILRRYAGKISEAEMTSTLNDLAGRGYQYYDQMKKYAKRNPFYQQYNLSVGYKSEKNIFRASLSYRRDALEDKNTTNNNFGINISNSTNFTKWLSLDLGAYIDYGSDNTEGYSVLSPGYSIQPYDRLVNPDGTYYTMPMSEYLSKYTIDNYNKYNLYNADITPLNELGKQPTKSTRLDVRTYARLNLKFTSFLKYSATFQYERGENRDEQLQDKESIYVRNKVNGYHVIGSTGQVQALIPYGNIMNRLNNYRTAYNFRQQLDFDYTINGKHNITAILGHEVSENKVNMDKYILFNYDSQMLTSSPVNQTDIINYSYAGVVGSQYMSANDFAWTRQSVNRFVSFYANAAYSYDGKYTATGSIRWDRSNLWGTSSKYQNKPIWSVGASWIISKENWFTAKWVDHLKLRVSYGIGGNVSKDSAPYMVASYGTNNNVGGTQGYVSSRPNPALCWEKTTTTNVGVDFSFLGNRLNGSFEFYNKKGDDLLANSNGVPTEGFGYSTYTINNGQMINRGIEASLNGVVFKNRDWNWSLNAMIGTNYNRVTYVNVECPVYYLKLDYASAYPEVGHEYNALYAYEWAGLSSEGIPQVYDENGEKTSEQPSSMDAIKYAGTTSPKYYGSFGTNLRYKNFDLSVLFTYSGGNKMRNTNPAFLSCSYSSIGYITNIAGASSELANRWQKPGDEAFTNVPKAVFAESDWSASTLESIYRYSTQNILDARYVKLNNIALAYHIPATLCQKMRMKSARIQFNVENPVLWAASKQAKYQLGGYNATNYVFGLYVNF